MEKAMNTTTSRCAGLLGLAAVALTVASPAPAWNIGIEQAREIALKAHPGRIPSQELELEDGGSGLRYSIDVKNGSLTQEVGVDAATGRILENKPEGPNPD
jgi:hypothetical protein